MPYSKVRIIVGEEEDGTQLVLEVPFFIAAYNFLSKLPDLQGARFGIFTDLSKPDALITIGGFLGDVYDRSRLYDPTFTHMFREASE